MVIEYLWLIKDQKMAPQSYGPFDFFWPDYLMLQELEYRLCWDLVLTRSLKLAIAFLISLRSSVGIANAAAPDFLFSLYTVDI